MILEHLSDNGKFLQINIFIYLYLTLVLSTITMNTTLIMFAVIAAFGLAMATVAVLPQAHATTVIRLHPSCERNPGYTQGQEPTHTCGGPRQR
jgi:hypothetical protein